MSSIGGVPDDTLKPMPSTLSLDRPFDAFSLLDDPQEWAAFSRPATSTCWESNLLIEGMHCAACSVTVEDALRALPGVVSADVSAGSHRAKVVWSSLVTSPSDLMRTVQSVGYRAVPANDVFARERRLTETRKALWRWLVAGLCMMQVMMYAWPAYIAVPGDLSPEMEQLLRWASWVLTLPVIVFSCGPFFTSAIKDLAGWRISMDLPVAIGMAITFVVSTAGTFDPTGPFGREVYFDSLTMFVFFLLTGRWLELRLRDQTAGALEVLMNRLPETVERLKPTAPQPTILDLNAPQPDGFERVAVRRLLPGDVIRVLPGEAFPADGVVTQGVTLVDESLLTGESKPVTRGIGAQVVAGSHSLSGVVLVQVERTGAQTRFAEIVALMENASTSKPQLALLADRIAKPFLVGLLLAALGACAYWWPQDPQRALMVAVAVLIVTCPCALSLATPAAMLATAGALAKSGVLVRRLQALEALSTVDTVVFDKTGTLTGDQMALYATRTRRGITQQQALAMAAALASGSLHPVSKALYAEAKSAGLQATFRVVEVSEITGLGVQGRIQGTLMTAGNWDEGRVRLGSATFCNLPQEASDSPQAHLADDAGWLATFDLTEGVRADARASIAGLQAAGVDVYLLSGDSERATDRVAKLLGITHAKGGCTPQEKLGILREIQQRGNRVAMVGDGLKDGPVLAGAHVSYAFGKAVPIAQAQADFVVLGDKLNCITQSVLHSRKAMAVVHQNLGWALFYNLACVPLAVVGWLPAWLAGLGMAGSSLVVVLNALRLKKFGS